MPNNKPDNIIFSGSYTSSYGEITDLYTTWSYLHVTQDQGFGISDPLNVRIALSEPSS